MMKGVSVKMANLNITNYLMKRLQGVNNNVLSNNSLFGTKTVQTGASIFSNIETSNLENFDYEAALNALSNGKADSINETANQPLSDIFKGLMSNDTVQGLADIDGDGRYGRLRW